MLGSGANRKTRFVLFPLIVLLLACMVITAVSCGSSTTSTSYTQPKGEDFSKLTWTEAFKKLHDKFSREYAFTGWKGLNWDALYKKYQPRIAKAQAANDKKGYYLTLREYIQTTRDGHVSIKPDDPTVLQDMAGGGFGLIVTKLDNGTIVAPWVKAGQPAANAGMTPGAQIIDWGGKPVKTALAATSTVLSPNQPTNERTEYEKLRFMVRAPVGTDKTVTFKNQGDTSSKTATLKAIHDDLETLNITDNRSYVSLNGLPQEMVEEKVLPGNIGYVRIIAELDLPESAPGDHTPTLKLFQKAISDFIDNRVTGVIVDVRSNSGGSDQMVADMMGSFYEDKVFYEYQNYIVPSTGKFEIWIADDQTGEYSKPGQGISIEPGSQQYTGPVVALVNNGCISSGEGVAMGIRNLKNAKVVGLEGTNGSFGMAGDGAAMPGGYEIDWPFGQSLDKNKVVQLDSKNGKGGVVPTNKVPMTLENSLKIAQGQDIVLEYGLQVLNQMIQSENAK